MIMLAEASTAAEDPAPAGQCRLESTNVLVRAAARFARARTADRATSTTPGAV